MSRFSVVFDACVLYPAPLRDLLLELATRELFQARWTDEIHDEWISNLLKNRPELSPDRLQRTRALIDAAVPDCLVTDYEHLIPGIELPDDDDIHIVAAAMHARANAIVTFNLKDFPPAVLKKFNLEPIHPDDFIQFQFDLNGVVILEAARTCRLRLTNPPIPADRYVEILRAQSLPKTADILAGFVALI